MKKLSKRSSHKQNAKKAAIKRNIKRSGSRISKKRYTGTFSAARSGYGFVVPDEEFKEIFKGDVFIPAKYTSGAINGDRVSFAYVSGERAEGRIAGIISRGVTEFTGVYRYIRRAVGRSLIIKHLIIPDDKRLCFDIFVSEKNLKDAADGDKVLCEIKSYPDISKDLPAYAKVLKTYGNGESLSANEAALIEEHKVRVEFPEAVTEEAERVSKNPVSRRGRLDLTSERIFTIDGADAKDLDDAISVKRNGDVFILGVHIADVSSYVKEGSELENEAYLRGTSIYYADKVIPMLPKIISNGCCSLNPGVNRRTLSAFITIDGEGNIKDCDIKESVINSKVRGVYSEVNDILTEKNKGDAKNSPYYGKYAVIFDHDLENILSLYRILEKKAKDRGVPELDTPEPYFTVEDGKVTDVSAVKRGVSEKMIEQFMIAANEGVARKLCYSGLPCIYRVHDEPDQEKLRKLRIFAANLGVNTKLSSKTNIKPEDLKKMLDSAEEKGVGGIFSYALLRSMMKAKYSDVPSSHFGIGAERYCHFTSPIRRFPDLCVHRIIKTALLRNTGNIAAKTRSAHENAERSNVCEEAALEFERDMEDLYRADHMSRKTDCEFDGIVSSVLPGGVFVVLDDTCEGFVSFSNRKNVIYDEGNMSISANGRTYRPGDRMKIRVLSVNVASRRVDFEEIR